jgi:hypothetical protein
MMFAPAATARFTRFWFKRRATPLGKMSSGGCLFRFCILCLFWFCILYLWIALKLAQVGLWLVGVTLIWAAQLVWPVLWALGRLAAYLAHLYLAALHPAA